MPPTEEARLLNDLIIPQPKVMVAYGSTVQPVDLSVNAVGVPLTAPA